MDRAADDDRALRQERQRQAADSAQRHAGRDRDRGEREERHAAGLERRGDPLAVDRQRVGVDDVVAGRQGREVAALEVERARGVERLGKALLAHRHRQRHVTVGADVRHRAAGARPEGVLVREDRGALDVGCWQVLRPFRRDRPAARRGEHEDDGGRYEAGDGPQQAAQAECVAGIHRVRLKRQVVHGHWLLDIEAGN
ncbi:MAG: hypothetical protein IPG72_12740 [Ardenticatenales bacterium]|nr:hypothetical protein [Ardenticatenales bacterium]